MRKSDTINNRPSQQHSVWDKSGLAPQSRFGGQYPQDNFQNGVNGNPYNVNSGPYSNVPNGAYGPPGGGMFGVQNNAPYSGGRGPGGVSSVGSYGSAYGGGGMYGAGAPMGSQYNMGSMYGMQSGQMGSMYGMQNGQMGSMYGMQNGQMGSMYGMQNGQMGSMYGSRGGMGSMYSMGGGPMGGSMYGMGGSMYGLRSGSLYSMGSFWQAPHSQLGTVVKLDVGYSYVFQSNLATCASMLSAADLDELAGRKSSLYSNRSSAMSRGNSIVLNEQDNATDADRKSSLATVTTTTTATSPQAKSTSSYSSVLPNSRRTDGSTDNVNRNTSLISTNDNIVTIAVVEKEGGFAHVKTVDKTVTVKDEKFNVSETLSVTRKDDKIKSEQVKNVLSHLLSGHNTALLISDDGKATKAAHWMLQSTIKQLIEILNQEKEKDRFYTLSMTSCALQGAKNVRDLLSTKGKSASFMPMKLGTSPIFGPLVLNVTSVKLESTEDCVKHTETLLSNIKTDDKIILNTLILKQAKKNAVEGKERDVFLSSLVVALSQDGAKPYLNVVQKTEDSNMGLFKYIINGSGVSVHAVCVAASNTNCASLLRDAKKLGDVKNTAPRSGNVRRFVENTRIQLAKWKKQAESGDKRANENVRHLDVMLKDAQGLLDNPETTEPPTYRLSSGVTDEVAVPPILNSEAPRPVNPRVVPILSNAENQTSNTSRMHANIINGTTPTLNSRADPAPIPSFEKVPTSDVLSKAMAVDRTEPTSRGKAENQPRGRVGAVAIVDKRYGTQIKCDDDAEKLTFANITMEPVETVELSEVKYESLPGERMRVLCEQFVKGTNTALLSIDTPRTAPTPMESPAWSGVRQAIATALQRTAQSKELRASVSLVDGAFVTDLLKNAQAVKLTVASSPLFGPVVSTSELCGVTSVAVFDKLYATVKTNIEGKWTPNSFIFVTLVLRLSEEADTLVSSFTACLVGHNAPLLKSLAERTSLPSHQSLLRYAIGGPTTTLLVMSLRASDTGAAESLAEAQSAVSGMEMKPARTGSVKEFLNYTPASIRRRRERAQSVRNPQERETMELTVQQMESMLADHEALMRDPLSHFPKVYTAGESAPSGRADPAKSASAANRPSSPPRRAGESTTIVVLEPDASPRVTWEPPATLLLGDARYDVTEVVQRQAHTHEVSVRGLAELERLVAHQHNVTLVGAHTDIDAPFVTDALWLSARRIVAGMLEGAAGRDSAMAELYCVVVRGDQLLADLLAEDKAPHAGPLSVVSSSIAGPIPAGVARATLRNAFEAEKALLAALRRGESFQHEVKENGAALVAVVMQRQKREADDVHVASLTVVQVGVSMGPYADMSEGRGVRSSPMHVLLGGVMSRSCTVASFLSIGKAENAVCVAALDAQKQLRFGTKGAPRSGSVKVFLEYGESAIKRIKASGRAEEDAGQISKIETTSRDHRKLLEDFHAEIPVYPAVGGGGAVGRNAHSSDKQSKPTDPKAQPQPQRPQTETNGHSSNANKEDQQPVARVVVITAKRNDAVAIVPSEDGTSITFEGKSYAVDEVVKRPTISSRIRSTILDGLVEKFLGGRNTAILTASTNPYATELSIASRTVRSALAALPPDGELFFSIVVTLDGQARDVLDEAAPFAPIALASSPLFGMCVRHARLEPITDAAVFDKHAAGLGAVTSTMIYILLVLKQPQVGSGGARDVLVSSLVLTLVGPNFSLYTDAAARSGLLQRVLGGECRSAAVLCLRADGERGSDAALDALRALGAVRCAEPRQGSVRRLLEYTRQSIRTWEGRPEAEGAERLGTLRSLAKDAEEMLECRKGVPPPQYARGTPDKKCES